jgi:hypothetical protein
MAAATVSGSNASGSIRVEDRVLPVEVVVRDRDAVDSPQLHKQEDGVDLPRVVGPVAIGSSVEKAAVRVASTANIPHPPPVATPPVSSRRSDRG